MDGFSKDLVRLTDKSPDISYLCTNAQFADIFGNDQTQEHDTNTQKPNNKCCPNNKNHNNSNVPVSKSRKYMLSFETTTVPAAGGISNGRPSTNNSDTPDCAVLNKEKCKAFWKFIDSDPKLKGLIKEGEFFHVNKPETVNLKPAAEKKTKLKKSAVQLPTDQELMKMNLGLAEDHRIRKEEARERLEKRRAHNNQLIKKSGQAIIIQKPAEAKPPDHVLAASEVESLSVSVNEMTIYDDEKIHLPKPMKKR